MYLNSTLTWDIDNDENDYPKEIKEIFFQNRIKLRKKYNHWVGEISKKFSNDIDWWVSVPGSRNPYFSEIYKTICLLETIRQLKNKKIIILTNSKKVQSLIKHNFSNKNLKIRFNTLKIQGKNYRKIVISSIFQIIIYLFIKLFYKKKIPFQKNLVLINTYPTNNLKKVERHFQFSDNFLNSNKKRILFTPTILITKNLIKVFKTINFLSKKNYFFKESIIPIKDLFFAISYPIRIRKFRVKYKKFNRFDLSDFIFKEISNFKYFNATMLGLINYKFVENLYLKKFKIKKAICWLENHEQRGWNYAFRKYFKSTETFGYQGFTNLPQLMNTVPTKFEEKFKVIPEKIIVSGKAYIEPRKEFNKSLKVSVGPSFVYQNVHKKFIKRSKIRYLVILTEFLDINLNLIKWLEYAINKNPLLIFNIKKPKILKMDVFLNKLNIKDNLIFCDGNLDQIFKDTINVITSGPTGSTIEALGYNCKLLLPIIDSYDSIYLKKINAPKKMYQLFNNKDQFSKYLNSVDKLKSNRENLNLSKYKNSLFEKVSLKKENIFL